MSTALANKPSRSSKTASQFPQATNFFDDLEDLSQRIAQRAFGLFQQRGGTDGWDLDDWFRAESELLKPVSMQMTETAGNYTIRAEVPDFGAKDLTVQVEPDSVFIRGKSEQKKQEKNDGEIKYREESTTTLCRRIALPGSVDPERATARLTSGVLELILPKAAPPKTIEVKAA